MRKFKYQHPTDRVLIFIIALLIATLVSVLWFYGERINILWQQNGNDRNFKAAEAPLDTDLKFYIQSALKASYPYQPVVDPIQKRAYIPEANFYLPLNATTRDIVYANSQASPGNPQQIIISTARNTNILPSSFDDVPCLQRHIIVSVDAAQNYDGSLVASKKLDDGRSLNIYRHQQGNCSEEKWTSVYSASAITDALQQARSY
jgi:hypothetical protein